MHLALKSHRLTRIASLASFSMQLTHLALGVRSQSCYLKVFSQSNAHIVLRKDSNQKKEHSLERNETTLVPQPRYENDSGIPSGWAKYQVSSFSLTALLSSTLHTWRKKKVTQYEIL